MTSTSHIEIYQSEDGQTQIEVRLEQETLRLSQAQMADLFEKDSNTIGLHLRNNYEEGELDESATTEQSSVVRQEGKRQVRRNIRFYNSRYTQTFLWLQRYDEGLLKILHRPYTHLYADIF